MDVDGRDANSDQTLTARPLSPRFDAGVYSETHFPQKMVMGNADLEIGTTFGRGCANCG
jgi:hypothetical protein